MTTTTIIINNTKKTMTTYRHEFSKEFMAELSRFSKVHQYDDRYTYKSEWKKWTEQENIAHAIDMEKRRLEQNGYKGDTEDKMYKAARYYFKKKPTSAAPAPAPATPVPVPDLPTNTADTTPGVSCESSTPECSATDLPTPTPTQTPGLLSAAAPSQRRPYITMSKKCIQMMDEHIQNASSAESGTEFKPSLCYDDFYQTKMTSDDMTKEIGHIIEKYEKTPGAMSNITPDDLSTQIMDKIKKTYKNRYYKYISSAKNKN
jgi:hypothetical protein